jgi:hypothetical protein
VRREVEINTELGLWAEINGLRNLKTGALRVKYQEVCGAEARSSN